MRRVQRGKKGPGNNFSIFVKETQKKSLLAVWDNLAPPRFIKDRPDISSDDSAIMQ